MTDEQLTDTTDPDMPDFSDVDVLAPEAIAPESHGDDPAPQYGVGPFTIREIALVAVWLVAFAVSFFPIIGVRDSVWTSGLLWILTIAVPTIAVFLVVLRRFSPSGIRRVGSLGIDQFASVAFSVAAALWLQLVWETVAFAISNGVWVRSWVMWVEFVLMLAGVVLTVLAPSLPVIGEDFRARPEVTAHRNARPVRAVVRRPRPEPRPAAPEAATSNSSDEYPAAQAYATPDYGYGAYDATEVSAAQPDLDQTVTSARGQEAQGQDAWAPAQTPQSFESPVEEAQPVASHQAFWALAPVERDVVDDRGVPMFRIGPTAWALVIEDRGTSYIIRHEDGRVGHLQDVSGVTRG